MTFIIDASASVGWFIENQVTDYSEAVAGTLEHDSAIAPLLWHLEMTNALRTACKRKVLDITRAHQSLATLESLPIRIEHTPSRPSELFALALRHNLSTYDATYLDLALRLRLPIATQDDALREAALASGVGVWMPE